MQVMIITLIILILMNVIYLKLKSKNAGKKEEET